jgi:cytidylate kinase
VRLRGPLDRRIDEYRREHVVDRRCAEKAVRRDDHLQHAWVRTLYDADVDDPGRFSLVLDASRFTTERIVEILLAAGGLASEWWGEQHDRRAVG